MDNRFFYKRVSTKSSESGFSLIEIIVVLIIVGVLASIALPRYQTALERTKSAEGVNILSSLLGAQQRYALENSGAYTNAIGNLDITIPASTNFNAPTVATSDPIASIQRTGSYTLSITSTGTVSCSGGAGSICTKMGY